jgi:uncharacterized protein (DUF4415 family)
MKRKPIRNTPDEEAAIQRGIALDPDNPEWNAEDWAAARPIREVMPDLLNAWRRSRGKQKAPTKVLVSLRLDSDVVKTLRASGRGWQSRANQILKNAVLGVSPE